MTLRHFKYPVGSSIKITSLIEPVPMNYELQAFLLLATAPSFSIKNDRAVISIFSQNFNFEIAKIQAVKRGFLLPSYSSLMG